MKQSSKIVFVVPRFPTGSSVGGAETLSRQLASLLAELGHKVSYLTTCASDHFTWKNDLPPGNKTIDNVDVHFFPVDENRDEALFHSIQDKFCSGLKITQEEELKWVRNSVNSEALIKHLTATLPDTDAVIAAPYLFGLTYHAVMTAGSKAILLPCLHDEPFAYLGIVQEMFKSVKGLIFNSAPEKLLAQKLYGLPDSAGAVVGMEIKDFAATPDKFAKQHNINKPYLIYSGRREPLKGTPLLIDYLNAFRQRTGRDVALVLTGRGDVNIPSALRSSVIDAGFLSEEDKRNAMAGALAFCHPSVNESFGIVIMESWLSGTPCLVHAGSEVLKYHCKKSNGGLWFRTYPEFETELLLLMDKPQFRNALGNNGRSYVLTEYSKDAVTNRLIEYLEQFSNFHPQPTLGNSTNIFVSGCLK